MEIFRIYLPVYAFTGISPVSSICPGVHVKFCKCTFIFDGKEDVSFDSVENALAFIDDDFNQLKFSSASIDAEKDDLGVTFWFDCKSAVLENLMNC